MKRNSRREMALSSESVLRMIQRQSQTIHYLCLQLFFYFFIFLFIAVSTIIYICVCVRKSKVLIKYKTHGWTWNSIKCVDWMWIPVFDVLNTQINYFTDGHLTNKYVCQFCFRFVGVYGNKNIICMNQFICAPQIWPGVVQKSKNIYH